MTEPRSWLPAFANLREYLRDRFPQPVTLVVSLAFGLACYVVAQAEITRLDVPVRLDGAALGGCALAYLFLFLLRVFDEHKDFDIDARTRPDRPVQRGVVTLAQLRHLAAIAVVAQLVLAVAWGWRPAVVFALPLGYSVLMYFEFWVAEWLNARLLWYALSHMVVMPMLAWALVARLTMRANLALPVEAYALFAITFCGFLSLEVLRKLWAPDHEMDGVDSYSKRLGIGGASLLASLLVAAACGLATWSGWRLGGGIVWLVAVPAVGAATILAIVRFARDPSAANEKLLQPVSGLHLLVCLVGLIGVAMAHHGVDLAW